MMSKYSSKTTRITIAVLIIGVLIGAGVVGVNYLLSSHSSSQATQPRLPSSPYFDYVVVILMENMGINWTYGSSCVGNCTYVTQLANTFSLGENYSAVAHRSSPNYLTLTSGKNYSYYPLNTDCAPQLADCYVTAANIIDRIEATGRTWKAYMEDYIDGGCSGNHHNDGINAYVNDHNPFLYYTDIYYNSSRCSRIINTNPGHEGYLALPTVLLSDLNNVSLTPNFMWLTPNNCDNGHSTCNLASSNSTCTNQAQCVSQGNEYLSLIVPQILHTAIFKTKNAALFITWDEGNHCPGVGQTYPICIDRVPAIFAGSHVKRGYVSNVGFSHYSFVKTLEVAWNFTSFSPLDDAAIPMTTFFDGQSPGSSEKLSVLASLKIWT